MQACNRNRNLQISRALLKSHAMACRGCWMPGANEVLGCHRKYFLFVSQNFWRPSFSHLFQISHFFASVVKFHENSLLRCPPVLHHAPVTTLIFSLLFCHLPTFFEESWPLGCPPGWMPGAVAPSAPPLLATEPCAVRQFIHERCDESEGLSKR